MLSLAMLWYTIKEVGGFFNLSSHTDLFFIQLPSLISRSHSTHKSDLSKVKEIQSYQISPLNPHPRRVVSTLLKDLSECHCMFQISTISSELVSVRDSFCSFYRPKHKPRLQFWVGTALVSILNGSN